MEKVNKSRTAWSVCIWAVLVVPAVIFCVMSLNLVASFADEKMKVMALIFFMYMLVKLFSWIGTPTIYVENE